MNSIKQGIYDFNESQIKFTLNWLYNSTSNN